MVAQAGNFNTVRQGCFQHSGARLNFKVNSIYGDI
jgi:hypothetical protein